MYQKELAGLCWCWRFQEALEAWPASPAGPDGTCSQKHTAPAALAAAGPVHIVRCRQDDTPVTTTAAATEEVKETAMTPTSDGTLWYVCKNNETVTSVAARLGDEEAASHWAFSRLGVSMCPGMLANGRTAVPLVGSHCAAELVRLIVTLMPSALLLPHAGPASSEHHAIALQTVGARQAGRQIA